MHVLFGGTKLLQSSGDKAAHIKTPDGGCLAVVLRTGFGTAQGVGRAGAAAALQSGPRCWHAVGESHPLAQLPAALPASLQGLIPLSFPPGPAPSSLDSPPNPQPPPTHTLTLQAG